MKNKIQFSPKYFFIFHEHPHPPILIFANITKQILIKKTIIRKKKDKNYSRKKIKSPIEILFCYHFFIYF